MRYNLDLDRRIDTVKIDGGYEGPVVVCAVTFSPIAGYDPERFGIKYLSEQRGIEISLAPIAGTRVVVPFRISVPTPLGTGVLQATRFVATHQARSSAMIAR